MSNRAPVGAEAPLTLTVPVETGDSGLDLSLVTAVSLSVRRPDREEVTWPASIISQSATELTALHVYDSPDIPIPGIYKVSVTLFMPDGPVPCHARPLIADSKFNL